MSEHTHEGAPRERHKPESPVNHYLSYIVSIVLTMIAFAAVMYGGLDNKFLLIFLVSMALVQVVFQLVYWMHMKERVHMYAAVALGFGFIVAITAVIAGVYWIGW
jgi:cytochrome c oxidase subunit 4